MVSEPSPGPARLTIRRPDDWHVHLRDGALLQAVVPYTARQFARAIVMPNLRPPITTVAAAIAYRARIREALPDGTDFQPLLTAYLTDTIDPAEVERGFREGVFTAAKLYPAHATTNAAAGVSDLALIEPVLSTMERIGMPLLIHGEVTDAVVDVFDREAVFIERHLQPLLRRHPGLKVVLEHITTTEAVDFVRSVPANLAATITPHHLQINRNAMFAGGLRPDFYCLPVAKRELHRLALRAAAVSGDPRFFLGTDSAPMAVRPRSRPAAAPASSTPPGRWRATPRCSSRRTPSSGSRPSPRNSAPASTACPSTRAPSPWSGCLSRCPGGCTATMPPAARSSWCPSTPGRNCPGAWPLTRPGTNKSCVGGSPASGRRPSTHPSAACAWASSSNSPKPSPRASRCW